MLFSSVTWLKKSVLMRSITGRKFKYVKILNEDFFHKMHWFLFYILFYIIYNFVSGHDRKYIHFHRQWCVKFAVITPITRHFYCRKQKVIGTLGRPQILPGSTVSLTIHLLQKLVNSRWILYSLSPGINLSKFYMHYCHQVKRWISISLLDHVYSWFRW